MRAAGSASALLMVVDDDELNRESIAHTLSARGFRVVEHESGSAAFAALHTGERPDLIVLDLVMPEMDGWEFRRRQLADSALAAIPVVAMSGDRSSKAAAVHAAAFLAKPLEKVALLRTVERVLARPRRREPRRSIVAGTARARRHMQRSASLKPRAERPPLLVEAPEAELEQFALISRGVSHVVNNTLQGLMSYVQCVCAQDSELELRRAVFEAAFQCAAVLRKFAECASPCRERVDAGELGPFEPTQAWRSLCPPSVELRVDDPQLLRGASIPAAALLAITSELISNAVEAIGGSAGTVHVRVRHEERHVRDLRGAVPSRNRRAGSWCCVEVADSGSGIRASELSRIWLPFYSTRFPGRGLGLAVVYARVSALGGLVEAQSNAGEGATIRLLLPLANEQPTSALPPQ